MKSAVTLMVIAASITLILCDERCSDELTCPEASDDDPKLTECCQYFKTNNCCSHDTNKRYKQIFITVVVISAVVFLVLLACAISVITCFCCALCRHDSKTPTTHTILTTGYIPVPRDGVINMNNNTNKTHT